MRFLKSRTRSHRQDDSDCRCNNFSLDQLIELQDTQVLSNKEFFKQIAAVAWGRSWCSHLHLRLTLLHRLATSRPKFLFIFFLLAEICVFFAPWSLSRRSYDELIHAQRKECFQHMRHHLLFPQVRIYPSTFHFHFGSSPFGGADPFYTINKAERTCAPRCWQVLSQILRSTISSCWSIRNRILKICEYYACANLFCWLFLFELLMDSTTE